MVMRIARILRFTQHLKASSADILTMEPMSINAYPARLAPTGETRDAAYRRLLEFGDKLMLLSTVGNIVNSGNKLET